MVVTWVSLLKTVPWSDVIANAPAITDGAKRLWNTVAKKSPPAGPGEGATATAGAPRTSAVSAADEALVRLQRRLDEVNTTVTELHGQMLASSELIKALADQNAELIKRIEANRLRLLWLSGAVAVVAVVAVASLVRGLA